LIEPEPDRPLTRLSARSSTSPERASNPLCCVPNPSSAASSSFHVNAPANISETRSDSRGKMEIAR